MMNTIEGQFCSYKIALALKELGFDEACFGFYDARENNKIWYEYYNYGVKGIPIYAILAPIWQQCEQWFREKYDINIYVAFCEYAIASENSWQYTFNNPTGRQLWNGAFKTYEEAREQAILKCIELCKK